MKRPWTQQDLDQLNALAPQHTMAELAQILSRTPDSVRDKLRKLGLKTKGNKTRSDEDTKKLLTSVKKFGKQHVLNISDLSRDTLEGIIRRNNTRRLKSLKKISQKRIESLRKYAISHACSRGRTLIEAEEFASYALLKFVENGGNTLNIKWTYSDWIKCEVKIKYDDNDVLTEDSQLISNATRNYVHITGTDAPIEDELGDDESIVPEAKSLEIGLFELIDKMKTIQSSKKRAIFLMHTYFGLEQPEIAMCFGITSSRVSVIISEVLEKLAD